MARWQHFLRPERGRSPLWIVLAMATAAIIAPVVFLTNTGAVSNDYNIDFAAARPTGYVHQGVNEGSETASGAMQ